MKDCKKKTKINIQLKKLNMEGKLVQSRLQNETKKNMFIQSWSVILNGCVEKMR